jgi:hypothetical protein
MIKPNLLKFSNSIYTNSAIYGLVICLLFAVLFFNPFTRANIAFAQLVDPDMRNVRVLDTSLTALAYFAMTGLLLGGLRQWVWSWFGQHLRNGLAILVAWAVISLGSAIGIYLGLRLLNPAFECMLEVCHSQFVLNYAGVTLGLSAILAYKEPSSRNKSPSPGNPMQFDPDQEGCSFFSGKLVLIVGILMVALLALWVLVLNPLIHPAGAC